MVVIPRSRARPRSLRGGRGSVVVERGAGSAAGAADDAIAKEVAVTVEVFREIEDLVRFDETERAAFVRVLARLKRETGLASWLPAEPAGLLEWRRGVVDRARRSAVA